MSDKYMTPTKKRKGRDEMPKAPTKKHKPCTEKSESFKAKRVLFKRKFGGCKPLKNNDGFGGPGSSGSALVA